MVMHQAHGVATCAGPDLGRSPSSRRAYKNVARPGDKETGTQHLSERIQNNSMRNPMELEQDDDWVAGKSPAVATLIPPAPAATPVSTATAMGAGGGLFTAAQWVELQRQALIYKHMAASAPIPSYLLFSDINATATATAAASSYYYCYNTPLLVPHYQAQQAARMSMLLRCMQQAVARRRCGRTDGKKWRCAREAEPDQRYCQRHLNRAGRPRHPPPAKKQQQEQQQDEAAVVDGPRRDRHKPSTQTDRGSRSSLDSYSSGGSKAAAVGGLLDFAGGVCLPEQRENRLSLNYDNITELYCNKQMAATATATATPSSLMAAALDDDASVHDAAASSWVGIGGPLGEVLGLATEIQWPVGGCSVQWRSNGNGQ